MAIGIEFVRPSTPSGTACPPDDEGSTVAVGEPAAPHDGPTGDA